MCTDPASTAGHGVPNVQAARRLILKGGAALALLAALPKALLAAAWPQKAFLSTDGRQALTALLGTDQTTPSEEITLKLPEIAENGAVVPVTISTTLGNVESISIVVENNPRPLAATFELMSRALPEISTRIKMAETSRVVAVVKTDTGIYSTSKDVKITIGGCA
jgi:sulfur-oxidizing protein SoxY